MRSNFIPKAAGVMAILGVASGVATAQTTFNVSATVQNALTITNDQDMNLGTLFAVNASDTAYKFVTLAPAGTWGTPTGGATVTLLTLGGQQAARGSVAVGSTTPLKVTMPGTAYNLVAAGTVASDVAAVLAEQGATSAVEVRLADPGAARFYLGNFRAGSISGGSSSADCGTTNSCTLTPSFGSASVSFGIGATLITDVAGGTRTTYEAANYTGSFTVTASY